MKISTFRTLASTARAQNPGWFMLSSDAPATDAKIDIAEAALAVRLPEDYRAFLSQYGGGDFAFMNVFSVDPESDWNIVARNDHASLPVGGFLGISDDETGGLYGYRVEAGACLEGIGYLDLSTHEIVRTNYLNALSLIAASGLRHKEERS